MKLISPFTGPKVPDDKRRLFEKHLFKENLQRCRLFAKIVILFESILIIMNITSNYSSEQSFSINVYVILYLILLFLSVFMLLYIRYFDKRSFQTELGFKRYRRGLLVLVTLFLIWGAVVTLIDQKVYGHVMAFVVNFMCVSILFHASNRAILSLYTIPILVLYAGLPFFQPSNSVLMGHYINLSVFLFFCWLASRMFYISFSTNYYNKILLMETIQNLDSKIRENGTINRKLTEANKQLKQLILVDELTGIPNRRGFQEHIQNALKAMGIERKLSLLMIDIDHFKLYNDNYGHLEGDKIIKVVAQKISHSLHNSDSFAARFGGEEFVIAIFDMDQTEVYQVAETIRKAVLDLKIPHEFSPVIGKVTISIGLASAFVFDDFEIVSLLEKADQALYDAKLGGRNRVEIRHLEVLQ
jgi:diguanylate cyclase (GGDEF)-like protein